MLFDPRDRNLRGPLSEPPPLPDLPPEGPVAEMAEHFGAEWDTARARLRTDSRSLMLADALQTFLDSYERETGETLANPYDINLGAEPSPGDFPAFDAHKADLLATAREKYERARSQPGDRLVSRLPRWPTEDELTQMAIARAQNAEQRAALLREMPGTALGAAASFAGMTGSLLADPINLATMFMGAPGSAGILRTMATEALVGAGVEAATKPAVMAWQREIGENPTLLEAAADVATAGVGAGIFAGLLKGGAVAWERVRPSLSRQQRAAIHVADALETIERRNPFEIARKIRARAERTGQSPSASFADELRVSVGDETAFALELDRLAREVGETPAAVRAEVTVERTAAGDQLVIPGAEQIGTRQMLERRMAARDIRGGQEGLEGLGLFDEGARARQTDLIDLAARRDPVEAQAVHAKAVKEAEASIEAGRAPDGPAIREVDATFPDLELPVWEARTGKGKLTRWRGPMDLLTWLRTRGGIKDSGGELAARDLARLNRGRSIEFAKGEVFLGRLVNDEGMNLDGATLAAWEAGYFPGHAQRPTIDDLLDAIDRTVRAGGDVNGRVWSEHDADMLERIRGRVDPEEESHWREILGDEAVDEAIDAIDGMPVLEEPVEPDLADIMAARAAGRFAEEPPPIVLDDEAELITLEALRDELAAGDFEATAQTITDDGEIVTSARSAREVWRQTEAEAAGMEEGAACMMGAADAA